MFEENNRVNVPEVLGNAYLSEIVSVLQSIILLRRCTPWQWFDSLTQENVPSV